MADDVVQLTDGPIEELDEQQPPVDETLEQFKEEVLEDWGVARDFMTSFHQEIREKYEMYHSAKSFTSLRKENKLPSHLLQQHTDQAVADWRDKLFFTGSPCRIVGREDDDKSAADAKQDYMMYQDEQDAMFDKFGLWLRDCCLSRFCVAATDYKDKKRKVMKPVEVPDVVMDPMTGAPAMDPEGNFVPLMGQDGEPIVRQEWQFVEEVDYAGASTRRIDPEHVFIHPDKEELDDEFPIMLVSKVSRRFFNKPYFFNQGLIDTEIDIDDSGATDEHHGGDFAVVEDRGDKRELLGFTRQTKTKKMYFYLEWHGRFDAAKAYGWLAQNRPEEWLEMSPGKLYAKMAGEGQIEEVLQIEPKSTVFCVFGLVNGITPVRLDADPYRFDSTNLTIGRISSEEGLIGLGIADKIEAAHKAHQELMGMGLENFKQSVDAQWAMDWNKIRNKASFKHNQPGGIAHTEGNPRDVIMRIPVEAVSKDIYVWLEMFRQVAEDADGLQNTITGTGDRGVETLGEANQVYAQAILRVRDYMKTFEDTFVKPMYRKRNHINSAMIDETQAYRIVGDKAGAWGKITPEGIRADTDFICDSAARETQRAVLIQQMLELARIAPLALQAGQPVRIDIIGAEMCSVGWAWDQDKIEKIWPLIAMEKEQGQEAINQMLAENATLMQAVMRMQLMSQMMMAQMGPMMGGAPPAEGGGGPTPDAATPGEQTPRPTTTTDALASLNARGAPNVNAQAVQQGGGV